MIKLFKNASNCSPSILKLYFKLSYSFKIIFYNITAFLHTPLTWSLTEKK